MQQIHGEGSVRHAEKRRIGTCQFANRIARVSLDAYHRSVPQSYREANKQTCVAAIIAHFHHNRRHPPSSGSTTATTRDGASNVINVTDDNGGGDGGGDNDTTDNDFNSHLQVMGLGVGTKFLPDAILREEQLDTYEEGYGKRIRDCHAEVLARRAFRCQIALEMLSDLDSSGKEGDEDVLGNGGGSEVDYVPILERVDGSDDDNLNGATSICYRLRSDVTLHFYASSAPCGNAVLKKFVKMAKETFDASLGPDEWPEQSHAPISAHSLPLGQFALLVKKDGSIIPHAEPNKDDTIDPPCPPAETQQQKDTSGREKKRRKKPWPCRDSDTWCPPSCSITDYDKGTIHSCSDKICRWNCLGMQGSLLMPVLDGPLHMTTLTVGRKFSRAICSRAVCCRAGGFGIVRSTSSSSNRSMGGDDDKKSENCGKYKLNHPTLMETNVYMDESGTHAMAGVTGVGRDASFDSNLCWVWWPGNVSDFGYAADCLNGKTGLRINYHDISSSSTDDLDNKQDATTPPTFSECSTFSLFRLNMKILRRSGVPHVSTWETQSTFSLSDLRRIKCQSSSQYESVKTDFFRHRVFGKWSSRYCR